MPLSAKSVAWETSGRCAPSSPDPTPASPSASATRWSGSAWAKKPTPEQPNYPAASSNGWLWHASWVQSPDLVLADEPFAAVDPVTTERVLESLLEFNREGVTLLVNLHDVEIARRFPRIVALREGRIAFDGPPERLTDEILARVYAGDPCDAVKESGPDTRDTRCYREDSGRVAEGRDGVSSH